MLCRLNYTLTLFPAMPSYLPYFVIAAHGPRRKMTSLVVSRALSLVAGKTARKKCGRKTSSIKLRGSLVAPVVNVTTVTLLVGRWFPDRP
jgi:hypothetical protein